MSDISVRSFFRGVGRTAAAIDKYAASVHKTAMGVCERLAEEAQREAQSRFADYEGPSGNDVDVKGPTLLKQGAIPVGYKIEASGGPVYSGNKVVGNSVVFEEFGSGLLAGSHPQSTWYSGIYPGSWSETYGTGEYAMTGQWSYGGDTAISHAETFVYIAPTYAMYLAGQRVSDLVKKTAIEGFK